jgi:hypothetical protein
VICYFLPLIGLCEECFFSDGLFFFEKGFASDLFAPPPFVGFLKSGFGVFFAADPFLPEFFSDL